MKKALIMTFCLILAISALALSVSALTTISSLTITNVPTPKAGNKPTISATVNTAGAELYSLDWYDKTAGRFLESSDIFTEGHVYEVQLWVEAKSGYEFRTNGLSPNVSATVAGKTAAVSKAYEYQAWAMVLVSYTFDPCPKKEIGSVDIQLDGITKSGNLLLAEQGSYIPFSIQSGDEQVKLYPELHTRYFPYGFRWSNLTKDTTAYDGDRFQGGCDYYVTLALKPRNSDYVFADDFTATIGGQKATIKSLGTTYAEIAVELTCYGTIAAGNINPVVSLPTAGNAPDYGLYYGSCEHIEYASISGWYDVGSGAKLSSDNRFQAGKQYRVEVTCVAAYGFKFQRDANDKMEYTPRITGHKVDSYSFSYDSYRGRELIKLVKTFTVAEPEHTHTAGGWQCDDSGHKQYCTVCGTDMGGSAHFGGTATCTEKGICTVCGYAYLEENENHTPDTSKWVARTNMYHFHPCKDCGAHCDVEDHRWSPRYHSIGAEGHAYQCADCKGYDTVLPHVPGPAATDTTPQTCTECSYIIKPATNHKHDLTRVPSTPATCTEGGNIEYYFCTGCNDCFTDSEGKNKIPETTSVQTGALGHTASEQLNKDEKFHWRICTVCNTVLDETKLVHEMKNDKCTSCGYVSGEPTDTTVTTVTTDPADTEKGIAETTSQTSEKEDINNEPKDDDSTGVSKWLWIGVISVAAFLLVLITILVIYVRKKARKQ